MAIDIWGYTGNSFTAPYSAYLGDIAIQGSNLYVAARAYNSTTARVYKLSLPTMALSLTWEGTYPNKHQPFSIIMGSDNYLYVGLEPYPFDTGNATHYVVKIDPATMLTVATFTDNTAGGSYPTPIYYGGFVWCVFETYPGHYFYMRKVNPATMALVDSFDFHDVDQCGCVVTDGTYFYIGGDGDFLLKFDPALGTFPDWYNGAITYCNTGGYCVGGKVYVYCGRVQRIDPTTMTLEQQQSDYNGNEIWHAMDYDTGDAKLIVTFRSTLNFGSVDPSALTVGKRFWGDYRLGSVIGPGITYDPVTGVVYAGLASGFSVYRFDTYTVTTPTGTLDDASNIVTAANPAFVQFDVTALVSTDGNSPNGCKAFICLGSDPGNLWDEEYCEIIETGGWSDDGGAYAGYHLLLEQMWWDITDTIYYQLKLQTEDGDYLSGIKSFDGTPTVASASPSEGGKGESVTVVLTGTLLTNAASVDFGAGITVDTYTVDSDTQITADITIASDAALGTRDISVVANGKTGTLTDGFEITAASESHYIVQLPDLGIPYVDEDGTKELHIALENLSPTSKTAGENGQVVIEIGYEVAG